MENASKALILAGEILIGVIILSILVFMFNKVNEFTEAYHENADKQKLIAFNAEYTKYITNNTETDATYIYAEDVVTIVNQAIDWNRRITDANEIITVTIITDSEVITVDTGTFNSSEFLNKYKLRIGEEPSSEEYKFSCEVNLNTATGRVNTVVIQYVS